MNICLIVIDTLRRDHIGAYGNDRIETPNMDRLAAESVVFEHCFTHSYPTIPHRTDVLTGEYGRPFHPWMPLRHDRQTFVEELGQNGYCTQLIHDTPHLVNGGHNFDWPFHAWTPIRGAEVDRPWVDDRDDWPANWARDPRFDFADDGVLQGRMIQTYVRANRDRSAPEEWNCYRLFDTASRFLRDNASRDNFLLWVDSFDPHEPWDAPPEFMLKYDDYAGYDGRIDPRSFAVRNRKDLPEDASRHIAAQYPAKVNWVDHCLGRFLDALEETGLADTTAVILTADHGTNVGTRGRYGKSFPVREQEARIPLMVHVPGAEAGRSDVIVQPQDIYATVMAIAGQETEKEIESFDVLQQAANGTSHRDIALAGGRADNWDGQTGKCLFTAFTDEWALEFAVQPECCRLERLGTIEDVSEENPDVVRELHAAAIDGIERRDADPALVAWLKGRGEAPWPTDIEFWNGYPGPAGYAAYFSRIYLED
jgi:arylsulfatase A-like enzyme